MTLYIGVDIHARQQTVSYLDTADGTTGRMPDFRMSSSSPTMNAKDELIGGSEGEEKIFS